MRDFPLASLPSTRHRILILGLRDYRIGPKSNRHTFRNSLTMIHGCQFFLRSYFLAHTAGKSWLEVYAIIQKGLRRQRMYLEVRRGNDVTCRRDPDVLPTDSIHFRDPDFLRIRYGKNLHKNFIRHLKKFHDCYSENHDDGEGMTSTFQILGTKWRGSSDEIVSGQAVRTTVGAK
jgi:hypothetical protein